MSSLVSLVDMDMQARRLGIRLPEELTVDDREWIARQLELCGGYLAAPELLSGSSLNLSNFERMHAGLIGYTRTGVVLRPIRIIPAGGS